MSLTDKNRNDRSQNGKNVPGQRLGSGGFAAAISRALREEFGMTGAAVKTISVLTTANERAVKNWLSGKNGPSGEFLILLCRHSDRVMEAVLILTGRADLVMNKSLIDAKRKLREMLAIIDRMD
ncbi:hypothetical protein MWN34_10590 [Ancylobacter sp. 6x-1]|uniref:XRE family transcriptional regulator n=1 Tax=Ancylobacter crimeensis TaxID=2579147 RepID=A0ABT0DBW2_9HYPH|nr:hypothetical protein [Ancylobacter crimeensis]MCK0197359.1 hypothetical protein [Ancylobacter crimeensis]